MARKSLPTGSMPTEKHYAFRFPESNTYYSCAKSKLSMHFRKMSVGQTLPMKWDDEVCQATCLKIDTKEVVEALVKDLVEEKVTLASLKLPKLNPKTPQKIPTTPAKSKYVNTPKQSTAVPKTPAKKVAVPSKVPPKTPAKTPKTPAKKGTVTFQNHALSRSQSATVREAKTTADKEAVLAARKRGLPSDAVQATPLKRGRPSIPQTPQKTPAKAKSEKKAVAVPKTPAKKTADAVKTTARASSQRAHRGVKMEEDDDEDTVATSSSAAAARGAKKEAAKEKKAEVKRAGLSTTEKTEATPRKRGRPSKKGVEEAKGAVRPTAGEDDDEEESAPTAPKSSDAETAQERGRPSEDGEDEEEETAPTTPNEAAEAPNEADIMGEEESVPTARKAKAAETADQERGRPSEDEEEEEAADAAQNDDSSSVAIVAAAKGGVEAESASTTAAPAAEKTAAKATPKEADKTAETETALARVIRLERAVEQRKRALKEAEKESAEAAKAEEESKQASQAAQQKAVEAERALRVVEEELKKAKEQRLEEAVATMRQALMDDDDEIEIIEHTSSQPPLQRQRDANEVAGPSTSTSARTRPLLLSRPALSTPARPALSIPVRPAPSTPARPAPSDHAYSLPDVQPGAEDDDDVMIVN